ncbi:TIGR00645 family protein [Telmatospirillum siberiense]|uniref:UPF0114 protein CWS72_11735 n=2 Tax=Telmatospirillum siberiense TaxID=382514 RepID=A0A2N3PVG2_9PROT|nr:TIGR00645 family protein [Telmatospirillum siberiense]
MTHNLAERVIQHIVFASRWLLAPIYAGMSVGLLVLLVKFGQRTFELVSHALGTTGDNIIVGILGLIDLALMGGLLVIVMFAGYENFVSKLDAEGIDDKPSWMGEVNFSELKLKLMASIIAISAIRLLENFMNLAVTSDRDLGWGIGLHITFVFSGLLLAVMDRLTAKPRG